MNKNVLFLFLFLLSVASFSQDINKSISNYKKGSKALDKKNYEEAISLLTLSITDNPTANAYFNRAVSHYYLGDSCDFCNDLKNAANMDDYEAGKLYEKECLYTLKYNNVPDSIMKKYTYVTQYQVVHHKCLPDSTTYYIFECGESNWSVEASKMMNYQFRADTARVFATDTMNVFTIVEELPQFPGGARALMKFIAMNIKYPESERIKGTQGNVLVQFVVDANGKVVNAIVLKGIGDGCDEEALRVINLLPKWIPGKNKGKAVAVKFNLPIKFRMK